MPFSIINRVIAGLLLFVALVAPSLAYAFDLKVEKLTDRVYALVGSINARSYDNDALNNTMGFVVTGKGVILIDSGATAKGAALLEKTVATVTDQPIKWVINTGSQDHRWLGNGYFASKGAQIIALARTVKSQKADAASHMKRLQAVVKDRLEGTTPIYAASPLHTDHKKLQLGDLKLELIWPGRAHFPNDAIVWFPSEKTVFTGDLVFMDRMLGIQGGGQSKVRSWAAAFKKMAALNPAHVVPGHGSAGDLAKARHDTGDYLDWLLENVTPAVENMEDLDELVKRLGDAPFKHLKHYEGWHKRNINRTFVQLESEQ